MIIQIYEIQHPHEAIQVIALGVTHVGTVLQAPCDIVRSDIQETILAAKRSGGVSSVIPLFTNEADICRAVESLGFDILHLCDELLHPDGTPVDLRPAMAMQRRMRKRYPDLRITRSLPVPLAGASGGLDRGILRMAQELQQESDVLLIDTWIAPDGGGSPVSGYVGITGTPCDWELSKDIVSSVEIPVILAGGLGPDNVAEAVGLVRPAGVDSCTRTNATDAEGKPIRFRKELTKVEAFVQQAKWAFALFAKGEEDHVRQQ